MVPEDPGQPAGDIGTRRTAVIVLAALALSGLLKTRPGRAAEPAAAPARRIR